MGASLVAQMVKNLPTMREIWIWFRVGKIPWRREWRPTSVFLPGEAHEIWPSPLCCDLLASTARTTWAKHLCVCAKLLQSCLTLLDLMDYSLPGSSVYGILLARMLGWVVMPFSRRSSWPRDQTWVSCSSCMADGFFTTQPPGMPIWAKMDA